MFLEHNRIEIDPVLPENSENNYNAALGDIQRIRDFAYSERKGIIILQYTFHKHLICFTKRPISIKHLSPYTL